MAFAALFEHQYTFKALINLILHKKERKKESD